MVFGLQQEEIESLVKQAIEDSSALSPATGDTLSSRLSLAMTRVVTENNARILEALKEAGIQLQLDNDESSHVEV